MIGKKDTHHLVSGLCFTMIPLIMVLLAAPASAQQRYGIDQVIEPQAVRLNEEVKLEIYLKASFSSRNRFNSNFYRAFTPPDLSAFTTVDKSESSQQSLNIINGQYYQSYTRVITYFLRPKKQGTIIIGASKAKIGGKVYRSKQLLLKVLPPREMPKALLEGQQPDAKYGSDNFVQAFVDHKQVYVGQPVVVTWYSYTFSRLAESPTSQLPDAAGFFNKSILKKPRLIGRVSVGNNVMLQYLLYRRIYWPQRSGELTIGMRSIQLSTRDSILSNKQYVRSTAPIKLKVLPLPQKGRPANFHEDNVGRFSIKSDLKATSLKTNEAIDVTFTIKGEGLLTAIKLNALPTLDWARLEPNGTPTVKERVTGQRRVTGESRHKYILIPTMPGQHTFPPVTFNYFDPTTGRYKVAKTKPIVFQVAKSAAAYTPMGQRHSPNQPASENILAPKIKPLHVKAIVKSSVRASFAEGIIFWLLLLFPPLLWGALGLGLFIHRARTSDIAGKKRREIKNKRRNALKNASAHLKSGAVSEFYGELARVIMDGVSFRIGRSAHGLTNEEMSATLAEAGTPQVVIEEILETLETFDFARYAPSTSSDPSDMASALQGTRALLGKIDKIDQQEVLN